MTINNETIAITLTDYATLKVAGNDAESFLQNQLTNDLKKLELNSYQETAWCNHKGRILANFRVVKRPKVANIDDSKDSLDYEYLMMLSKDLAEQIVPKISMYIMMSNVEVTDISNEMGHFSLSGENATDLLQENAITSTEQVTHTNNLTIIKLGDNDTLRYQIIGTTEATTKLWNALNCEKTDSNKQWKLQNIHAGIAEINAKNTEQWVPQMVNYIEVGGVDFKKGCYPGQEVVARLNYLGKSKRKMFLVEIATEQNVDISALISSESDSDAGKILNAVRTSPNSVSALAVIKTAQHSNNLNYNGDPVAIKTLPYEIADLSES